MERRTSADDRRHMKRLSWGGPERRSGIDRRTINQRRITLSQGYGRGWLTFESLVEKRRLVPIPSGWEEASNAALRALCDQAKRIAKTA
jgi:putative SOS response-associated peptidase YedK